MKPNRLYGLHRTMPHTQHYRRIYNSILEFSFHYSLIAIIHYFLKQWPYMSFSMNQGFIHRPLQVLKDILEIYPVTHRRSLGYDWCLLLVLKHIRYQSQHTTWNTWWNPLPMVSIHCFSLYVLGQQSLEKYIPYDWKIHIWILLHWFSSVITFHVYFDLDVTAYVIYYNRS